MSTTTLPSGGCWLGSLRPNGDSALRLEARKYALTADSLPVMSGAFRHPLATRQSNAPAKRDRKQETVRPDRSPKWIA